MNLLILLLSLVILLLLVIIAMLATGWPGRQREEIERLGNSLRREMAEQRSDNLQLMKAIRIVIEDAVKESVEREVASSRPRSGRSRKAASSKAQDAATVRECVAAEEEPDNGTQLSALQAMQISLFPDKTPTADMVETSQTVSAEPSAEKTPEPETIHMGFVDDIPEISE
jgi:hypothetical protein